MVVENDFLGVLTFLCFSLGLLQMESRYKTFATANSNTIEKVSISTLPEDVPHLILKVAQTRHEKFGENIKIVFRDCKKNQKFTYLPPRISKKLKKEDVDGFNDDVLNKRPPLLIFRGMNGKSFNVELLPFCKFILRSVITIT